jgi:hypothetical protein
MGLPLWAFTAKVDGYHWILVDHPSEFVPYSSEQCRYSEVLRYTTRRDGRREDPRA